MYITKDNFDHVLYTDGGALQNPGPAACAYVLRNALQELVYQKNTQGAHDILKHEDLNLYKNYALSFGAAPLGECTNNVAEYTALIWGLLHALHLNCDNLLVLMDSELIVKQLNGQYACKNATLKHFYAQALHVLAQFKAVRVEHIYRAQNACPDILLNRARDNNISLGTYTLPVYRPLF